MTRTRTRRRTKGWFMEIVPFAGRVNPTAEQGQAHDRHRWPRFVRILNRLRGRQALARAVRKEIDPKLPVVGGSRTAK